MEDAVDWVPMARFVAINPGVDGSVAEDELRKGHHENQNNREWTRLNANRRDRSRTFLPLLSCVLRDCGEVRIRLNVKI